MSASALLLASATGATAGPLYVDDVFLANTRTGTGVAANIAGPDMTAGGLAITKSRSATTGWRWTSTARGATKSLDSTSTAAEAAETGGVTAFTATGMSVGTDADYNASGVTFVDYLLKQADKFFKTATKAHTNGVASTIDLSSLGVVGMVIVKRTDSTGNWMVWHLSLTAGSLVNLNLTAGEAVDSSISVSGTTLTLSASLTTGTYDVEAFAHNTATDGVIQCGSYAGNADGTTFVHTGWEPQALIVKRISGSSSWAILDNMRGLPAPGGSSDIVRSTLDSTNAESAGNNGAKVGATGFYPWGNGGGDWNAAGATYIYIAIRRPNKPPTSGAQVFNALLRTGTAAAAVLTGVGFVWDALWTQWRSTGSGTNHLANVDRLRGRNGLQFSLNDAESAYGGNTSDITSFDRDGISIGAINSGSNVNSSGSNYVHWFFKRAPGVMDTICYSGSGANKTEAHGLVAVPELWFVKRREAAGACNVGSKYIANTDKLLIPGTAAVAGDATAWSSTYPTSTALSIGTQAQVNAAGGQYIAHLFATFPGISKVGTYSGTGAINQVDCGFSAGARFVLIKRTDGVGDWYLWDSVRGIVSGNDPYLLLNSSAVEVTATDYIDPYAAGFELSSTAPAALNAAGGTYLFLAFA